MSRNRRERKREPIYAGELKVLAASLGRSTSTLSRLISNERPSKALADRFHRLTGFWPHEVEVIVARRPEGEANPFAQVLEAQVA